MTNIDVGKLQIIPFEFYSILEVKIEKELNPSLTDKKAIMPILAGIIAFFDDIKPVYITTALSN